MFFWAERQFCPTVKACQIHRLLDFGFLDACLWSISGMAGKRASSTSIFGTFWHPGSPRTISIFPFLDGTRKEFFGVQAEKHKVFLKISFFRNRFAGESAGLIFNSLAIQPRVIGVLQIYLKSCPKRKRAERCDSTLQDAACCYNWRLHCPNRRFQQILYRLKTSMSSTLCRNQSWYRCAQIKVLERQRYH